MIVPMSKYSFLIYHKDRVAFMQKLMNLGILHVILKTDKEDESTLKLSSMVTQAEEVQKSFAKRDKARKKEETATLKSLDYPKPQLKEVPELETRYKELLSEKIALLAHIKIMKPWSVFDWATVSKMENATGVSMRFCRHPKRKFNQDWLEKYPIEIINEENGFLYFIIFQEEDNSDLPVVPLALPKKSLSELNERLNACENEIFTIDQKLGYYSLAYSNELEDAIRIAKDELFLQSSILNLETLHDEKVVLVEGWCPKTLKEDLHSFIEKDNIVYTQHKSTIDENPPILLKNNKFSKLFEPIGELYTLPKYGEIDLTVFFAPFYMLFFGFCLGDAGYGLLIVLGTIYGLFKAKDKYKPLLKLGMYLGIATTLMGIVGGTFFGIFLIDVDWQWLKSYQEYIMDSNSLMIFALGLGYIQVLYGMFIKAVNKAKMYGFKYSISQLGWNIIVMISLPLYGLGIYEFIPTDTANNIALISLIIGGIPALFYNTPGKNPLVNLGTGVWDTYQMASGLLGDVLSYIRLFALGLSSAILGNVFNTLAMDLSPDNIITGPIVMVLILAFGHGLNFFMALLGSFVHPLRLTFVEFYKNAGFIGGGRGYKPFKNEL